MIDFNEKMLAWSDGYIKAIINVLEYQGTITEKTAREFREALENIKNALQQKGK